jgi:hypothetical protein
MYLIQKEAGMDDVIVSAAEMRDKMVDVTNEANRGFLIKLMTDISIAAAAGKGCLYSYETQAIKRVALHLEQAGYTLKYDNYQDERDPGSRASYCITWGKS